MSYVVIDGCPAPARLEPLLRQIKVDTGCTYQSIYRGADASKLLNENGKQSQAQLYYGWTHRLRGYNPANPPGRSTHELRSDAVAYAGPVGRKLAWWQVGIDVDDPHVAAFIAACAKHGWHAHITYPSSPLEYHHVNLTQAPKFGPTIWWRLWPVKRGSRGLRARWVIAKLRFLASPADHERYLKPHGKPARVIGKAQQDAIERFQRDHHQKADGIVGVQTMRQIRASYRSQKKKRSSR